MQFLRQRNQIAFQRIIQKNAAATACNSPATICRFVHPSRSDSVCTGSSSAVRPRRRARRPARWCAETSLATLIDGRPHEWASWHRARAYQEHDIGGIAGVRVRYELHHVIVERDSAVLAPCRMRHFATDRPQLGNLGEPRRREVHVLVQRRPTASEHIRPPRLFDGIGLAPRIIGVPDNERRPR